MSTKKLYDVCIAGGGIGGIALALRLRILNQKISIYLAEKDRSFSQRSQGYGLTLQQANKVLNDLNIKRQIQEVDTPNDAHYTYNKQGELLSVFGRFMFEKPPPETLEPPTGVEKAGKVTKVSASKLEKQRKWQKENQSRKQSKRYNFHVPRQKLREILLDELNRRDPSIVNWDRSVKDFDIFRGGRSIY